MTRTRKTKPSPRSKTKPEKIPSRRDWRLPSGAATPLPTVLQTRGPSFAEMEAKRLSDELKKPAEIAPGPTKSKSGVMSRFRKMLDVLVTDSTTTALTPISSKSNKIEEIKQYRTDHPGATSYASLRLVMGNTPAPVKSPRPIDEEFTEWLTLASARSAREGQTPREWINTLRCMQDEIQISIDAAGGGHE